MTDSRIRSLRWDQRGDDHRDRCGIAERTRAGSALLVVLLLLLALTGLGHGAFLVAMQEGSASRATSALLQARLFAEGNVLRSIRGALADTLPETHGATELLAQGSAGDGAFLVGLRRLSREIYWIEGTGRAALSPGGPLRVHQEAVRLLWAMSPVERLRSMSAALEVGSGLVDPAGSVEAWAAREPGAHRAPAGCLDRTSVIDSILSGRAFPAQRGMFLVPGRVPSLGLMHEDSLLARVGVRVSGTVTPGPVTELGECVTAELGNWGSPSDPTGPCGGYRPARIAEQLTVAGGEGQGLLVVRGDLRLMAGARFDGLALVGGELVLEDGAALFGMARVAGSVRVGGGSRLSGRVCPALLALEAQPGLRRPIDLPGGGWIRPF
jgi:hypothetical protein